MRSSHTFLHHILSSIRTRPETKEKQSGSCTYTPETKKTLHSNSQVHVHRSEIFTSQHTEEAFNIVGGRRARMLWCNTIVGTASFSTQYQQPELLNTLVLAVPGEKNQVQNHKVYCSIVLAKVLNLIFRVPGHPIIQNKIPELLPLLKPRSSMARHGTSPIGFCMVTPAPKKRSTSSTDCLRTPINGGICYPCPQIFQGSSTSSESPNRTLFPIRYDSMQVIIMINT